jgi:cell division protein FtsQ
MIADPRPRRPSFARMRRPGPRVLAGVVVVLALLAGAFLWLRHSSLVAVQKVTITGVAGPDAAQIRNALRVRAETMSTLDVSDRALKRAVAAYPVVRSLDVSTHFPHGLSIAVFEQVPVAVISAGGAQTEVSASGTLLRRSDATGTLPVITVPIAPAGRQVSGATAREVALLADAPYTLLDKIATAGTNRALGLMVTMRDGPTIYFGADAELAAKWRSATAALADPNSAGADYIDVTDPGRPAAGTGSDGATAPSATSSTTTSGVTTATGAEGTGTAETPSQQTITDGT